MDPPWFLRHLARTNKYAGYRFAVTSALLPDKLPVGTRSADYSPLDQLWHRAGL